MIFNNTLEKLQQEITSRSKSLQLRSELLWWKEACYSPSSDKSYKLERRGRWNGGEAGKQEVITKYENMPGYDKKVMPVRYSSGGIIEYFVTFYE